MSGEEPQPINCTEDGKVTKIILKEGEGDATPAEDQEVDVNYIGTLLDGSEFDSNKKLDDPFQFFIGTEQIIKGWNHGVKTMKKGEIARFTIAPEYAYGAEGREPKIPSDATLIFEITLIDFRDRTKSKYDYEPEERIQAGINFKTEGNEAFKSGDLVKAKALYWQAVEFLEEEKDSESTKNIVAVHTNLSLIAFKAENWGLAVTEAEKAMQRDPTAVKAYYRRGQANLAGKNYEAAIMDFEVGLEMDGKNIDLKRALITAKKEFQILKNKERNMYSKMFSGGEIYETPKAPKDDYSGDEANSKVFMDIKVGDDEVERLEFELYVNAAPKCAENFRALCTGEKGKGGSADLCYKGHVFHRLIKGFMLQGGDIERKSGAGGESIYGNKFNDEPFLANHTKRGQLSMANAGPNTNGSQFFICFEATPHLNGKHNVFGCVSKGLEFLTRLEAEECGENDLPKRSIEIVDCGQL